MSRIYNLAQKGRIVRRNVNLHAAVAEVLRKKTASVLDEKGNVVLKRGVKA